MSKTNTQPSLIPELFSLSLYKKNQGRLVRSLTAGVVSAACAFGCLSLSQTWLSDQDTAFRVALPSVLGALACWFSFRLVQFPKFAEFLIAVQSELDKVSWPAVQELWRATFVVLGSMFVLCFVLLCLDFIWYQVLSSLQILQF